MRFKVTVTRSHVRTFWSVEAKDEAEVREMAKTNLASTHPHRLELKTDIQVTLDGAIEEDPNELTTLFGITNKPSCSPK